MFPGPPTPTLPGPFLRSLMTSPHGLPAQPEDVSRMEQRPHDAREAVQLPPLLQQLGQQQQNVLQDVQHRLHVLTVHPVRCGGGGEVRTGGRGG